QLHVGRRGGVARTATAERCFDSSPLDPRVSRRSRNRHELRVQGRFVPGAQMHQSSSYHRGELDRRHRSTNGTWVLPSSRSAMEPSRRISCKALLRCCTTKRARKTRTKTSAHTSTASHSTRQSNWSSTTKKENKREWWKKEQARIDDHLTPF